MPDEGKQDAGGQSGDSGLTAAIAEAVGKADLPAITDRDGDSSQDDWALLSEGPPPGAPGESQPSKDRTQNAGQSSEGTKPTEDEVPTEYWGIDLNGLPAELRKSIIDRSEQQESYIHKLQAQVAEQGEVKPPEGEEDLGEVSDEELLKAINLDPEMVDDGTKHVILPLLRTQLALEERLEAQEQRSAVSDFETSWNQTLDALESEYGQLVIDPKASAKDNRVMALRYAYKEGITSPYEAYFRISAPVKKEVESAVFAARRQLAQRDAGGSVKPRSTDVAEPTITKGMTLRDAVAAGMKAAEKETKVSWRSALSRRKQAVE